MLWGASGAPRDASGTSRGAAWGLQGRLSKRIGMLWGSFWELRGRIINRNVETMELLVFRVFYDVV